jgi:hypothetical protein
MNETAIEMGPLTPELVDQILADAEETKWVLAQQGVDVEAILSAPRDTVCTSAIAHQVRLCLPEVLDHTLRNNDAAAGHHTHTADTNGSQEVAEKETAQRPTHPVGSASP